MYASFREVIYMLIVQDNIIFNQPVLKFPVVQQLLFFCRNLGFIAAAEKMSLGYDTGTRLKPEFFGNSLLNIPDEAFYIDSLGCTQAFITQGKIMPVDELPYRIDFSVCHNNQLITVIESLSTSLGTSPGLKPSPVASQ